MKQMIESRYHAALFLGRFFLNNRKRGAFFSLKKKNRGSRVGSLLARVVLKVPFHHVTHGPQPILACIRIQSLSKHKALPVWLLLQSKAIQHPLLWALCYRLLNAFGSKGQWYNHRGGDVKIWFVLIHRSEMKELHIHSFITLEEGHNIPFWTEIRNLQDTLQDI